jgi:putative spermidine/putrescine transport system permease protein
MATAYVWPVAEIIRGSFLSDDGRAAAWQNYKDVLNSYYFRDSLIFTLKISALSALISAVLAVILALALRESFAGRKFALFVSRYNLSVPRMAAAMMMVFLLSQTGLLSAIARNLGSIGTAGDFPMLVYDSRGIGLIIAFTWKFFPYIGITALAALTDASREYELQAATLGIGKFKRFVHIVLPSIVPAVAVSSILTFAAAFGDYELPAILGSSYRRSVSVMIYLKYLDPDMQDRPEAYALMVITSAALMALILTARRIASAGVRKRGL